VADAEYYREQSEFCARMADTVTGSDDKNRWLKLAQQWRELESMQTGEGRANGN
jgi:hypothetical protein